MVCNAMEKGDSKFEDVADLLPGNENVRIKRAISNIEARLEGVLVGVGAAPSLPLAVEGQARRLIAEVVSHKNLGKMYVWWMPWF
ncbi:non-specific serine/threonine protein kinase [Trifolium repens]|nr:non-specific serine/threonine protein kinase [Trifolium repens]WJX55360.1 non-specific serine/threonine protein kinase [Trifolium repens]